MDGLTIPGVEDESLSTLLNVRDFPQYCDAVRDLLVGKCTFCGVLDPKNVVIFENKTWRAWANPFPHPNHDFHFVAAPKEHRTHVKDLTKEEYEDMTEVMNFLVVNYQIDGGAFVMRFGNPKRNAGSIRHLHFNLQVPDGTARYSVTLAKDPEEIVEKMKILQVFEEMRLGTAFADLSPEKQALVKDRLESKKTKKS